MHLRNSKKATVSESDGWVDRRTHERKEGQMDGRIKRGVGDDI